MAWYIIFLIVPDGKYMGGCRLYLLNGKVYLQVGDFSGPMINNACAQVRTVNPIDMLRWHHIVAERIGNQASNFKIYVDGVLQATEVVDFASLTSGDVYNEYNGRLVVGNGSGSGGMVEHFIGYIKNVRVYKSAIDASVVAGNYSSCDGSTNTTDLVLWSKIDEGSGLTVTDYSTYNTSGSLIYATGWGGGVGLAVAASCIIPKNSTLCSTTATTLVKSKG